MYIGRMGLLAKATMIREQAALATKERQKVDKAVNIASELDKANAYLAQVALTQAQAQKVIDASIATGEFISVKSTITPKAVRAARRQAEREAAASVEQMHTEAVAVADVAATVKKHRQKVIQGHFKKLRRLITAFAIGLTVAQTSLPNVNNLTHHAPLTRTEIETSVYNENLAKFAKDLGSSVSNQERDILAKMLYGEAGLGTDPFEVLHTVLNRKASPLFKGSIADIVTAPNQYLGYKETNPVTPAFRRMVDMVVDEWEANGEKTVDGCHHFYFVTGRAGKDNKFEDSPTLDGRWVPYKDKKYAKLGHYCPVAEQQAARYYQQYGHGNHRSL